MSSSSKLEENLTEVFKNTFGLKLNESLNKKCAIEETINNVTWDSIKNLELLIAVEQKFNIDIKLEDLKDMNSFSSYLNTIERYVN